MGLEAERIFLNKEIDKLLALAPFIELQIEEFKLNLIKKKELFKRVKEESYSLKKKDWLILLRLDLELIMRFNDKFSKSISGVVNLMNKFKQLEYDARVERLKMEVEQYFERTASLDKTVIYEEDRDGYLVFKGYKVIDIFKTVKKIIMLFWDIVKKSRDIRMESISVFERSKDVSKLAERIIIISDVGMGYVNFNKDLVKFLKSRRIKTDELNSAISQLIL